ncbi:RlpA-like double-psi beta-barrel-protein domain-containing protein-containing protein, partial [Vararia minispora EC-137]
AIEKRGVFTNTRFTYYDITVGQCARFTIVALSVVALNAGQYGTYWKSQYCGQSITISYGGKTAQATIVDECPGCPYGGLDLTEGLFKYFADTSLGVVYGQWSWS